MLPAAAVTRARAEVHLRRLLTGRRPRLPLSASAVSQAQHTQVDEGARHVDSEEGRGDCSGRASGGVFVDFEHTREAYKSKDSLELLRSLMVLKMCSFDFLVDKNQEVTNPLQYSIRFP